MEEVAEKLDGINRTLKQMLAVMRKPEHVATRVLKAIVLIAGALAILNSADIIRTWIAGG